MTGWSVINLSSAVRPCTGDYWSGTSSLPVHVATLARTIGGEFVLAFDGVGPRPFVICIVEHGQPMSVVSDVGILPGRRYFSAREAKRDYSRDPHIPKGRYGG